MIIKVFMDRRIIYERNNIGIKEAIRVILKHKKFIPYMKMCAEENSSGIVVEGPLNDRVKMEELKTIVSFIGLGKLPIFDSARSWRDESKPTLKCWLV